MVSQVLQLRNIRISPREVPHPCSQLRLHINSLWLQWITNFVIFLNRTTASNRPLDKQSKDLANKRITAKTAPPRTASAKPAAGPKGTAPKAVPKKPIDSLKKEIKETLTNGEDVVKPPPSPPAADNALLPDVIAWTSRVQIPIVSAWILWFFVSERSPTAAGASAGDSLYIRAACGARGCCPLSRLL